MVAEHQQDYPSVTAAAQAVAKQLGLGRETVRRCLVQADIDTGGRPGMTSAEHAEIKRLKTENRRLREDVEILRAATTFFASMTSSE
jgi:transposase-like protein